MSLKDVILSALFPKRVFCFVCNGEAVTDENGVCLECAKKLKPCSKLPLVKNTDGFAAALLYTQGARTAMHRFKYSDAQYLAEFFTYFMQIGEGWKADAFVPVPLHKKRLRKRGYNQSALIADILGNTYNIPVDETILTREKTTRTQTALGVEARRKNVKNAFAAKPCKGKSFILVDDVKTTGSTLSECAKTLKKAGAQRVYALAACADELPYEDF
ncbi:MAG TPA: ComF family protein [Clostridia bacterium]|nr:ComF family protein [Clostridia bacterium]